VADVKVRRTVLKFVRRKIGKDTKRIVVMVFLPMPVLTLTVKVIFEIL